MSLFKALEKGLKYAGIFQKYEYIDYNFKGEL